MTDNNVPASDTSASGSNPVLVMSAVLAGYSAFTGGLLALDIVPAKVVGLLVLLGTAVTIGWGVYTRGRTVPLKNVVAKSTKSGLVVAGPAANADLGARVGEEVVVSKAYTGEVVAPPVEEA